MIADPHGSVFTRFLSETLTMEAVAYADIASGEELTISCKKRRYPEQPISKIWTVPG